MVTYIGLFVAFFGICLPYVSSLNCYSCFSYNSHKECESRYNLKNITCHGHYDTCLKYEMKIRIPEKINNQVKEVNNPGYARFCGRKEDCNTKPQICRHTFQHVGEVIECKITCCDEDIDNSKCHKAPHWPGTVGSTNLVTSNYTNNMGGKGTGGSGAPKLTASIWFLFIHGAFLWMLA